MPVSNTQFFGIGKGSAQIVDTTSGAQQGFAQLLARQQAQRQQELKQLTDQQAQLKPDGLRNDADRQDFFNQVNDWRNKSIGAMNERDPYKKSLAQSEAQQAYMQAQNTVAKSKEQSVRDNQFNQFAMNNATRHQLTDDAVTKGLANMKVGVNNPNIINDYSSLQRTPDLTGFDKRLKELNDTRLNNTQENYKLGPLTNIGNTQQTPITKYKEANALDQAHDYLNEATVNPEFANVLQHKYPQLYQGAQTEQQMHEAHALASAQLVKDNHLYKDMGTTFTKQDETDAEKAALHAKNRLFDAAHPTFGQLQSNALTPAQVLISGNPSNGTQGMLQGNTDAMKRLISLTPKGQYGKTAIPQPAIDPATGEHVFTFPAQQTKDLKAEKAINDAKLKYSQSPQKEGGFLGIGGKPIPFEQSDKGKKIIAANPLYKEKKPTATYRLNPSDPQGYVSQAEAMAADQNIKLPALNQILGQKGGRGAIPLAVPPQSKPIITPEKVKGLGKLY